MHRLEQGQQTLGGGEALLVIVRGEESHRMAGGLEFVGDNVAGFGGGDGEGDERGRHVEIFEGAGHGVLAADSGDAQLHLCPEGAQKRGHGLAPALRLPAQALKVFLKAEIDVLKLCAGGDQLADALHHGQIRAVVGALFGEVGVEAPGHDGAVVGVALLDRDLLHHGLNGGELVLAAEGHEHGARADG